MPEGTSLWALFIASFLAATLLPGGSEAVLFGVLKQHAGAYWPALALATAGNTLGGMTSYLLGRLLPPGHHLSDTPSHERRHRAAVWARRYGAPAMLAAWVPLIGDPLCVAAGWLRLNWATVALYMALGKFARYWAIAWMAV